MSIPSPDPHPLENSKYAQLGGCAFAGFAVAAYAGNVLFTSDATFAAFALVGAALGVAIGYRFIRDR